MNLMTLTPTAGVVDDSLRGLPPMTVKAVQRLRHLPSRDALNHAVRLVLEFYLPSAERRSLSDAPGTTRLREDLGVDSLTLAEAVFKWDDLFGTSIETREAAGLKTLEELEVFLAEKMALPDLPS
jgi:acyl carrier protein